MTRMLNGSRVLLVEDDLDLREELAELLIREGASVSCADNGASALGKLSREPAFDLIVTDVFMPLPRGTHFAAMARTAGVTTPILVITGHTDGSIARIVSKLSRARLLYKPFSCRTFLEQAGSMLDPGRPSASVD